MVFQALDFAGSGGRVTPPDGPLTDQPLVYVPSIIDCKLYSVGPNGRDDCGQGDDMDLSWHDYQY